MLYGDTILENRYIAKAQLLRTCLFTGRDSQNVVHQLISQALQITFGQQSSCIKVQPVLFSLMQITVGCDFHCRCHSSQRSPATCCKQNDMATCGSQSRCCHGVVTGTAQQAEPLDLTISAYFSTSVTLLVPPFWVQPSDFSSNVEIPPFLLPGAGFS